jgi:hypothetical protein
MAFKVSSYHFFLPFKNEPGHRYQFARDFLPIPEKVMLSHITAKKTFEILFQVAFF